MKPPVASLWALFVVAILLAASVPAGVTAQSSACNPQVQTCL